MTKILKTAMAAFALACLAAAPATAQSATPATEQQMKEYVDLMRKDVRKEVQSIVDQAMDLEAGSKAKFWGVYANYQKEMKALWDQRLANIKKYADNYKNLTDAVADELANNHLNNEQQNLAIRKKYHQQMKAALGSKIAARFLQVESMIGQMIGLQLSSEIPLID